MPVWEQVVCYKCGDCGRIYPSLPATCICVFATMAIGDRQGSFIISDISLSNNILATCILCGCANKFTLSELKRKKSCGCVPANIELLNVTQQLVKYRCDKCNKTSLAEPPIIVYCCEDDSNAY